MRETLRFLLHSGRGRVGLALIGAFVVIAVLGRVIAPYDPLKAVALPLAGVSGSQPFGVDAFGRDELSRILSAALPMLRITIISVTASAIVGTFLGVVAGWRSGFVDNLTMRTLDVVLAFPVLVLAIGIVAFFGVGEKIVTVALAIAFVPGFARVARAGTLTVIQEPYVAAARSIGDRAPTIMRREVLPNILPLVLVQASLSSAYAILGESALSFLSLSVQPPDASWGRMLAEGRDFLSNAPHLAIIPGLMITFVVIGFNLLGDGLRDFLDPRLRDQVSR
jgi:peptide/nickel transport system permease protein